MSIITLLLITVLSNLEPDPSGGLVAWVVLMLFVSAFYDALLIAILHTIYENTKPSKGEDSLNWYTLIDIVKESDTKLDVARKVYRELIYERN